MQGSRILDTSKCMTGKYSLTLYITMSSIILYISRSLDKSTVFATNISLSRNTLYDIQSMRSACDIFHFANGIYTTYVCATILHYIVSVTIHMRCSTIVYTSKEVTVVVVYPLLPRLT